MILAVISDTHGMLNLVRKTIRDLGKIDYIIHLGDNVDDAYELSKEFGIALECVKGNCDFAGKGESEKIIEIDNKKILITHGHKYYVKYDYNTILEKARELKVDAVFFGHTHIPMISRHHDVLLLNPGSPSLPREGAKRTIAVVAVDTDGIVPRLINLEEIQTVAK